MPRLALALDVTGMYPAISLVEKTSRWVEVYKIGLQLFTREGPPLVRAIADYKEVFLDLKLNDIPATVVSAIDAAAELDVTYMTIHALGGPKMIEEAVRRAERYEIKLLVVTVLTSLDNEDLHKLGLQPSDPLTCVHNLATMAKECGANGFVCSAKEVGHLRTALGPEVTLVTPGIRFAKVTDDQKRIATPQNAVKDGADILVVGRPIRTADDPEASAKNFYEAINAK